MGYVVTGELEGGPAPGKPEESMDMSMATTGGGASAGPAPPGEPPPGELAPGELVPPGEAPGPFSSELLWRLATRLYRDHDPRPGGAECVICHQRWPCSGRRLAELGLIRARLMMTSR